MLVAALTLTIQTGVRHDGLAANGYITRLNHTSAHQRGHAGSAHRTLRGLIVPCRAILRTRSLLIRLLFGFASVSRVTVRDCAAKRAAVVSLERAYAMRAFLGVRFPVLVPVAAAKGPHARGTFAAIGHAHLPAATSRQHTQEAVHACSLRRKCHPDRMRRCADRRPRELPSPAASPAIRHSSGYWMPLGGVRARGQALLWMTSNSAAMNAGESAVDERGQR